MKLSLHEQELEEFLLFPLHYKQLLEVFSQV